MTAPVILLREGVSRAGYSAGGAGVPSLSFLSGLNYGRPRSVGRVIVSAPETQAGRGRQR
jgi:hypothetical protein